mmetsp:Transcript_124594/g.357869  ORF Transcript_124594/g.357869 Transcript_124594/m.357869 type:complete len:238 (-) Transcript_124594:681-1394(-)
MKMSKIRATSASDTQPRKNRCNHWQYKSSGATPSAMKCRNNCGSYAASAICKHRACITNQGKATPVSTQSRCPYKGGANKPRITSMGKLSEPATAATSSSARFARLRPGHEPARPAQRPKSPKRSKTAAASKTTSAYSSAETAPSRDGHGPTVPASAHRQKPNLYFGCRPDPQRNAHWKRRYCGEAVLVRPKSASATLSLLSTESAAQLPPSMPLLLLPLPLPVLGQTRAPLNIKWK